MQETRPNLKSYLDLHQLLQCYRGTHETNRSFFLEQESLSKGLKPETLLASWHQKNSYKITEDLDSKEYLQQISSITTLIGVVLLLLGLTTGFGLLSYSGAEPVNVIYILFVVFLLPLLSMGLSILSMFLGTTVSNWINHLSPLFYLEKLTGFLGVKKSVDFADMPFSLTLTKWIFLQRLQLFSFLFYLGLFVAFVFMIVTKDIAFGWSTTLQVTPESFHNLLSSLGIFWREWLPSAIPSLELVELSHYFRLGEKLDASMISHADKLGAWWKFLAMVTLVYAIFLRLLFLIFSSYGLQKHLEKEFFRIDGVKTLLHQFRTPFVSTQSVKSEKHLDTEVKESKEVKQEKRDYYHALLGWNFTPQELFLLRDSKHIDASVTKSIGGSNGYKEDIEIAKHLEQRVVIYVKSWEPPTMDFIDLLEEMVENSKVKEIHIFPVGTADDYYEAKSQGIHVWRRKIQSVNFEKVGLIDEQ